MKLRTLIPMSLMILGSFGFSGAVRAQSYYQDQLREIDRNLDEIRGFIQTEAVPRQQQFQRYMNALSQECNSGNTHACNEYIWRSRQISNNLDVGIRYFRSKRRY
jgi:hypothetical protein